ncbi:MAG TPA: hypothetical protein VGP41_16265 [Candidatus Lustribacter sp.]|nr:hypothetical protein [Candidatus Lustribacter sp.]
MLRLLAISGVLFLSLGAGGIAQTAPAPPAAPVRSMGATFALRGAYHAIADAEARGASGYLDAAKTHYRDAMARLARNDPGAASEAMAAAALARAAVAERPVPAPRDIPSPPALVARVAPPMMGRPPVPGPQAGGPQVARGAMFRGPRSMGGRFDATRLAADAKLANTAEARDLAQKALDADIARTRAAFGGNADEAMRQGRLASSLAMAVRALAFADHPPSFKRSPPRPATVGSDLPAAVAAPTKAEADAD